MNITIYNSLSRIVCDFLQIQIYIYVYKQYELSCNLINLS